MQSIDIPLANGWHVTIFPPAMWLLVLVAAGLVVVAVKAAQTLRRDARRRK
jgi:hypothetical protein